MPIVVVLNYFNLVKHVIYGGMMHKLLCWIGIHTFGEFFHKDIKRGVDIEFPRLRRMEVTDERVYRKCSCCGKEKLILSIDSEWR